MRNLRRLAWVTVVAAAAASPVAAQQQGGGNQGGGNFPTFPTTTQTAPTTSITQTATDSGSSSGSLGTQTQTELAPVEKAPTLQAPSVYAKAATGGAVLPSNFLAATYANPYYSGALDKARTGTNPGGFGAVSFGGTATGGARAGVTTTTGRAGGGGAFSTDPGGQIVALPRQIAYTAQLKFAAPVVAVPRLQADLRGMIDRAGLTVPAGSVQVDVTPVVVNGQVVGNEAVLRGTVRDGDEARVLEGMVRLTPGVTRINTQALNYPGRVGG